MGSSGRSNIDIPDEPPNIAVRPIPAKQYGYSPPLTNLAAQTEFSQPQKDCSGSSKDAHGL